MSKPEHKPTSYRDACPACQGGDTSYDHEAVMARRPHDFEDRRRGYLAEIASGKPTFDGITLHPDASRRARLILEEEARDG